MERALQQNATIILTAKQRLPAHIVIQFNLIVRLTSQNKSAYTYEMPQGKQICSDSGDDYINSNEARGSYGFVYIKQRKKIRLISLQFSCHIIYYF